MFKKLVALMSMTGLFASLFLVQGLAFASTSNPDYLIWHDSQENVRWDVYSLLGSEPVPFGGLQNEYLYIGSDEPFYGVDISFENGSSDGEFQLSYYRPGSGLVGIDGESYSSLEGTLSASWDDSDWGDWATYSITDANYELYENAFASIEAYWVVLETVESSSNTEVLTASEIQITTSPTSASAVTSSSATTSSSSASLSHDGGLTFSDVAQGEEETVEIEFLVADGVLKGYDDGTFRPDREISRAELMKVLVAGQGIEPQDGEFTPTCFSDVEADDWFEPYVCYALDQGWVKGYDDGTFGPHQTVKRAEAAKMVVNGMGFGDPENIQDYQVNLLPDVELDDWFAGYAATLSTAIVVPNSEAFNPSEGMTRESAASFIFRVRALQETSEDYYTTDVREDFLDLYNLGSLIDLAYTSSSSSSSSSSSPSYNVTLTVHGSCSNPSISLSNYSGMEVDFSNWYVSSSSSGKVYPFSGVVLSDRGSTQVTASGEFGIDGVTSPSIYVYTPDGTSKSSSSCSNS